MYTKHTWLPRLGTGLNKFANSGDAEHLVLTPEPDTLTQEGTPFSAAWMNELEGGTYYANRHLGAVIEEATAGEALATGEIIGVCSGLAEHPNATPHALSSSLTFTDTDPTGYTGKVSVVWLTDTLGVILRGTRATIINKTGSILSCGASATLNDRCYAICASRISDTEFAVFMVSGLKDSNALSQPKYGRVSIGKISGNSISFACDSDYDISLYVTAGRDLKHSISVIGRDALGINIAVICSYNIANTGTKIVLFRYTGTTLSQVNSYGYYWNDGDVNCESSDVMHGTGIIFYGQNNRARIVKTTSDLSTTDVTGQLGSGTFFSGGCSAACVKWEESTDRALVVFSDYSSSVIKLALLSISSSVTVTATATTEAVMQGTSTAYAPLKLIKLNDHKYIVYFTGSDNKPKCFTVTTGASSITVSDVVTLSDNTSTVQYGFSADQFGHNAMMAQTSLREVVLYGVALPEAVAANDAAVGGSLTAVYDGNIYDMSFSESTDISSSGVTAHAYVPGCLSVKGWWKNT